MEIKYLIGWSGKLQDGRTLLRSLKQSSITDFILVFFNIPCNVMFLIILWTVSQRINVGNLPRLYNRLASN